MSNHLLITNHKEIKNNLEKYVRKALATKRRDRCSRSQSISTEQVHTGLNFIDKAESCTMVRFVRVTYVRSDESAQYKSMYSLPSGFSYKTFTPAPIKVAMCSGAPEYEPFNSTWERAKVWLNCVSK